jgi:hypothetical protein
MMAESKAAATIIPLNGTNYPTWKVQCKMALIKDDLWNIVNEMDVDKVYDKEQQSISYDQSNSPPFDRRRTR